MKIRINHTSITTNKVLFQKNWSWIFDQLEWNRHISTRKQCLYFGCKQIMACETRCHVFWFFRMYWIVCFYILLWYSFLFMHWKNSQNSWIIFVIGNFQINNFRIQSIKFIFSKFFFNIFWFLTKLAVTITTKKKSFSWSI